MHPKPQPIAGMPPLPELPSLHFARSESKQVGLHGSLIDKMRANSVRIVGWMKFVADMFIGFSGNPFLIGYSVFSGIGRLIMIGYGTKANQQKEAEKAAGKAPEKSGVIDKILHPSKYPVEAAAGSSIIGEASAGAYGIELIRDALDPNHYKGWPLFICELFAVYSYGNLLFSKEKKEEKKEDSPGEKQSLVFAKSHSKQVGITGKAKQWMKEHPVIVSSIINIGVGITMMCYATGVPYFIGASILLLANVVQALLVKKREFNVEGALEDKKLQQQSPVQSASQQPAVGSHTARLLTARTSREAGDDMAVSPA